MVVQCRGYCSVLLGKLPRLAIPTSSSEVGGVIAKSNRRARISLWVDLPSPAQIVSSGAAGCVAEHCSAANISQTDLWLCRSREHESA